MVGRATTKGSEQSQLSKRLSPPKKWSYLKLLAWFAVVSFVALVIYIHAVMATSSTVSSLPVRLYGLVAGMSFISSVLLTWRHNHFSHSRRSAQWDRSFICERCGAVSQHDLHGMWERKAEFVWSQGRLKNARYPFN